MFSSRHDATSAPGVNLNSVTSTRRCGRSVLLGALRVTQHRAHEICIRHVSRPWEPPKFQNPLSLAEGDDPEIVSVRFVGLVQRNVLSLIAPSGPSSRLRRTGGPAIDNRIILGL